MFYEVGVGKKFLIHSQIMEDLKEKMHNFNIINIKILFSSKTKKRRKENLQRQPTDWGRLF